MPRPDQIITSPPPPPPPSSLPLRATLRSDRAHRRSTMHRAAAAGLDLGLGLGLGLASQGSLTSSTTTASSSPASQAHAQHWTAALNSVVGAQESYGLHPYASHQRKEEPGRTSTSPESGVSAGTKRGLERTGSGVSRGAATAGSDEDDDGGDGAGGRKKLRLSKDQAAVLEECFKTHSTLNPKQKTALANRLGLRPRQVEVWFQNRRARTKLKQTEVDCEYMKRWCEQLAEQNKRLEKEVAELRALKTAPAAHAQQAATLTMCPSCRRVAATAAGPAATQHQHQHQQPQQCSPKPNAHPAGNVLPSHCQFFPSTTTAAAPDRSGRQQGAWNGAAQPLVTRELF
ncbi:homeobox-leucine zipper protein HOX2-like [Triticum dicoccoides]|nr:homeobox-leucine zipper protein HOX2-like [Triticum dicoccoides]XP_044427332.1 homeobox-leucine zipper protein HOX2-like [Triticum aestivum]